MTVVVENNQKQTPKVLDLSTGDWTTRLMAADIFVKRAIVQARKAIPGEIITTALADGTIETINTADENMVIITNPGGEEYIIDADKFTRRYEPTDTEGFYHETGMVRAVRNPTGDKFQVIAPWGKLQFGGPHAIIAVAFDPYNPEEISTDRYIIGAHEFKDTYMPYEAVYGSLE